MDVQRVSGVWPAERPTADAAAVARAAEQLRGAARPLLLAGSGAVCSAAWDGVAALANALGAPVLTRIATAHGVDPARVVLRWHIQHGIVVIPKSATPERIAGNARLDGFELAGEEMAAIDALSHLN